MRKGEILATGTDSITITLDARQPEDIAVVFDGETPVLVSCNPTRDELDWELVNGDVFSLAIHWNVNGLRVIKWSVWYS
jgi:hypothetical protein